MSALEVILSDKNITYVTNEPMLWEKSNPQLLKIREEEKVIGALKPDCFLHKSGSIQIEIFRN